MDMSVAAMVRQDENGHLLQEMLVASQPGGPRLQRTKVGISRAKPSAMLNVLAIRWTPEVLPVVAYDVVEDPGRMQWLDKKSNEQKIRDAAARLHAVVAVLSAGSADDLILIPDTNALLASADPAAYRGIAAADAFQLLLLPTVLSELEKLKMLHRNPEVRDKAKRVVTRIKGWRTQGPLLEGVRVDRTITVRAVHNEPKVADSLSWLDADNEDDRIIASVLDIQATSPSAHVVLVTGDINLQNKADAVMVETAGLDITPLE